MKLSEDLVWRGLIKDKTFDDVTWIDKPRSFYFGVDASSNSLTIGNLAALMLARRLKAAGWNAFLLVGGATSLIGDPGGKDEERPLLPREEVQKNTEAIKKQITTVFGDEEYTPVDNFDWFKDVLYLDFLREVGKHFSMTELMQRDFISERMGEGGSGISYAEFSYSLIQGYDYWQLYKNHKVVLQIGASDQWGNILSGVALIRKKEGKQVHALCMPLVINKSTGKKFGKTEAGAVWLDPNKTSPTQFFQFWMNVDDDAIEDYLKVFTLLSKDEIEQIIKKHEEDPSARYGQTQLALNVAKIVHGDVGTDNASIVTKYLTAQASISDADEEEMDAIRSEIPFIRVKAGVPTIEILVNTKLANSNTEARRLLSSGAVYINGETFNGTHIESKLFKNKRLILRRGKAHKDSALVELE